MRTVFVIGATSELAHQTAKKYASEKARFFLAARNSKKLEAFAEELRKDGAESVGVGSFDAEDPQTFPSCVAAAEAYLKALDVVLIAHGWMPDENKCLEDATLVEKCFQINFHSIVSLVTNLLPILKRQASGTVAVISSVAGDRGRSKNITYGTSKAALNSYLSGLRTKFYSQGIHFLTIKPGFVNTPMTAHLKKSFLVADADKVGKDIFKGIEKKRNVLYTPCFWWVIMTIIKLIPECIFKKLKI